MRVDCFNVIIDDLVVELNGRKQAYVEVSDMLGFLWRVMDNSPTRRFADTISILSCLR